MYVALKRSFICYVNKKETSFEKLSSCQKESKGNSVFIKWKEASVIAAEKKEWKSLGEAMIFIYEFSQTPNLHP